nr:quinone-dependent dihydroorotate dehydrogenase [Candidatus Woesebacteria bacterium]
ITNGSYEGNDRPMLGRLPKSRALLVNKGFKNLGADATIRRLKGHRFLIPVGVSIGRTNSLDLKTQRDSIEDVISAFTKFENSTLAHSYYELNISCPNLKGDIEFYTSAHLEELLIAVDKLSIKKPLFVKMPVEKSDKEVEAMLAVIAKHCPRGVIFGNLQKDRKDPSFDPGEIEKAGKGNFGGKPTYQRSNELTRLAYAEYKDRFTIIGCGGIFSAEDAYTKIKLGASLVQLITGMIYEGPQLIAQINMGLEELLKRDGYKHLSEAVGVGNE